MMRELTVLTWNLNGETYKGEDWVDRQLEFIDEYCSAVDLFCFQAVNNEERKQDRWAGHLGALLRYFDSKPREYHTVHTGDWARELRETDVQPHTNISGNHNRCNVIVSRWPVERRPLDLRNTGNRKPRGLNYYYSHFPEKILVADVDVSTIDSVAADRLEAWNVSINNGAYWGEEKVKMLETVYGRIHLQNTKIGDPLVLSGDFNAPQKETAEKEIIPHSGPDYTNYPQYGDPYYFATDGETPGEFTFGQRWSKAEQQLFDPDTSEWEMRDAYLSLDKDTYEASTVDYTHEIHNGSPGKKRLDHVLVSSQFAVTDCEIWNGRGSSINAMRTDETYRSDHAPVVATVRL